MSKKISKDEFENWKRVKEQLEKVGKTDCHFYTRAVVILDGKEDPLK